MKKVVRILGTALVITALAAPIAFAGQNNESDDSRRQLTISKTPSQAEKAAAETARMKSHLDNVVTQILNTKIGNAR